MELKYKIHKEDWSYFDCHSDYNSEIVAIALCELIDLDSATISESIGNKVLNVIGNNHAGTYYPVVLKALDYIIEIEKNTENKVCRICSRAILNDIYYFEPDVGICKQYSSEALKRFVKEKLQPYSDENISF